MKGRAVARTSVIELHEDAKSNFDNKGTELLMSVQEAPPEQNISTFSSDLHIKHVFTEKDIIDFKPETLINGFGEDVGFSFYYDRKKYGIYNDNYKTLLKLTESITKIPAIRASISKVTIKNLIHDWIHKKSTGSIIEGLTEYVINGAISTIVSQEIWLPIKFLQIEIPFTIGRITFKPITKIFIDDLETAWIRHLPDKAEEIKEVVNSKFRAFQGHAAATLNIQADPNRAEEIALEETEKSLLMLRLFSAAAFHPKITSIYDIWGSERVDKASLLFLRDGTFNSFKEGVIDNRNFEKIHREAIKLHMESGLRIVSDLLVNENKDSFQQDALEALFIFARCATLKDPADKLLYMLAALESLLLRDDSEPIQQNLSERMAFLIENTITERRQLIKDVKKAYAIRSSFVHHGASIDDYDALTKFMWHAWRAITVIISTTETVKTKKEFLDKLDERKLA